MKSDINVSYSGMTGNRESGRSMVEMLGVLAIIGVLSVAGIAGYSMAMRKYRANEIVAVASSFYMLAEAGNLAGNLAGSSYGVNGTQGLEKAGISKPFGTVDMSYDYATKKITVTGVGNKDVCSQIEAAFANHSDFQIATCS